MLPNLQKLGSRSPFINKEARSASRARGHAPTVIRALFLQRLQLLPCRAIAALGDPIRRQTPAESSHTRGKSLRSWAPIFWYKYLVVVAVILPCGGLTSYNAVKTSQKSDVAGDGILMIIGTIPPILCN